MSLINEELNKPDKLFEFIKSPKIAMFLCELLFNEFINIKNTQDIELVKRIYLKINYLLPLIKPLINDDEINFIKELLNVSLIGKILLQSLNKNYDDNIKILEYKMSKIENFITLIEKKINIKNNLDSISYISSIYNLEELNYRLSNLEIRINNLFHTSKILNNISDFELKIINMLKD